MKPWTARWRSVEYPVTATTGPQRAGHVIVASVLDVHVYKSLAMQPRPLKHYQASRVSKAAMPSTPASSLKRDLSLDAEKRHPFSRLVRVLLEQSIMLAQPPILLLNLLKRSHSLDETFPSLSLGSHFEHGQRVAVARHDDQSGVCRQRVVQTPDAAIETVRDRFQCRCRAIYRVVSIGGRLVVP